MTYQYKTHQIQDILSKEKCLTSDDTLELEQSGKSGKGRTFDTRPELIDGGYHHMRYLGKAPVLDDPTTYDTSFLLANHRVRGIGYNEIERQNFRFKKSIPRGWHLNVCDPNLPTNDDKQNIHQPLENFNPTDFHDFINQTSKIWKIDLGWEWEGELFK